MLINVTNYKCWFRNKHSFEIVTATQSDIKSKVVGRCECKVNFTLYIWAGNTNIKQHTYSHHCLCIPIKTNPRYTQSQTVKGVKSKVFFFWRSLG